jgi:hypothetical protein
MLQKMQIVSLSAAVFSTTRIELILTGFAFFDKWDLEAICSWYFFKLEKDLLFECIYLQS